MTAKPPELDIATRLRDHREENRDCSSQPIKLIDRMEFVGLVEEVIGPPSNI